MSFLFYFYEHPNIYLWRKNITNISMNEYIGLKYLNIEIWSNTSYVKVFKIQNMNVLIYVLLKKSNKTLTHNFICKETCV